MKRLCLIAAVLFACRYVAMAQSSTSGDLIQLENRFNDALVRADLKTIDEIEADDLIFTDATGTVTSKADEMQSLKSGDVNFELIQMTETRVQDFGNMAVVRRLMEKARHKNADISGTYRFTDVWVTRKGKWEHVAGEEMHCFRRFRSAVLTKNGCPEDLRKFWLGHENPDISDEYTEQLLEDIEHRQEVAVRIGLGFEIPEPSFVPNVPKAPEQEEVGVCGVNA